MISLHIMYIYVIFECSLDVDFFLNVFCWLYEHFIVSLVNFMETFAYSQNVLKKK